MAEFCGRLYLDGKRQSTLTCNNHVNFLAKYCASIIPGHALIGASIITPCVWYAIILTGGEIGDGHAIFKPSIHRLRIT